MSIFGCKNPGLDFPNEPTILSKEKRTDHDHFVQCFLSFYRMSDGGLLLSWNDSSYTTYMKEEVDRLVGG